MCVANHGDVLGRRAEFHGGHRFRNQLGGHRPNDVYAEDAVGFFVGDDFHKAGGVTQRAGAAIGHERERACAVFDAVGLDLLLGLAHPRDFRRGVDHPRHGVEFHVAVFAGDALCNGHALFLGLVRKHRTAYYIAHGPYIGKVGFAMIIHCYKAALIQFQPYSCRV